MTDRDLAYKLLKQYVSNRNLIKHCLAVEAIMGEIASDLNNQGKDYQVKKWKIAGLVHDIDYDQTADDPHVHSLKGAEILENEGFSPDIVYAVKVHNQMHGFALKTDMDIALYASDLLSGLIVASALISPEKKLKSIDARFVINRFGEKSFARGADRSQIKESSRLGFSLEQFVGIGLGAMQEIDKQLGL
ncbi:MAG: HDIG domain-containing protein [Actinomycetota bacterium]|nr:HDIG domain-containing protein [Actinomycetota bacterium]